MPDPADTGIGETTFIGRQSAYDFNYRIFPEDLGQEDMSHYMVININVQTKSSGSTIPKGNLPTGTILGNELSKVDQLRRGGNGRLTLPDYNFSQSALGQALNDYNFFENTALGQGLSQLFSGYNFSETALGKLWASLPEGPNGLPPDRKTTRIKESIALHMPNGGLVYTEENKYEEVSMTAVITGAIATAGSLFGAGSLVNNTASAAKRIGQIAGYPINPAVEVLFAARPQRQWMFEVFMLPRSETEVNTVREIIRTLRYHAAPEIIGNGFFFSPPAEFDITFFQAGKENKNLPRINTCVLDRIDVDYSPEQAYSTFANGHPIAVRLSLGFREVEILHKQRVFEGF